ncbi:MAG: hypothetical protein HY318_19370 [Armatimonadetes bacterium]|nr:hypothetical protein [Armatimonadota bacterium]
MSGPDSSGVNRTFVNPRTGWIHISNLGADKVKLVDAAGKPMEYLLTKEFGEARETMRFLPAGRYSISVPRAKELTVRTAGQSVHATANIESVVPEFARTAGRSRSATFSRMSIHWR